MLNSDGFGLAIELKNQILFVGFGRPYFKVRIVHYIFDGWLDEEQRKRFFGDVEFLIQEAAAGRNEPTLVDTGIINIDAPNKLGGHIKVLYKPNFSGVEQIESFLRDSKIAVHRADPFEMSFKTIWQFIQNN